MPSRIHEVAELTKDTARKFLQNYDAGQLIDFQLCSGGLINSNYLVDTDRGRFLLRIYSAERTADAILFEMSLLSHLAKNNFPCQRPIKRKDRDFLTNIDGRTCCLMTLLPGHTLADQSITLEMAEAIGRAVGSMQRILSGFVPEGKKENKDFLFTKKLAIELLDKVRKIAGLTMLADSLHREWKKVEVYFSCHHNWDEGAVHADISADNIISCEGKFQGVIDFDDAYLGWTLGDVALTIMEFSFDHNQTLHVDFAQKILDGVTSERFISNHDKNALIPFMQLLSFKFFGYTLPLADKSREGIENNSYVRRILALGTPQVVDSMASAMERAPTKFT